jgi:hypothetical protein
MHCNIKERTFLPTNFLASQMFYIMPMSSVDNVPSVQQLLLDTSERISADRGNSWNNPCQLISSEGTSAALQSKKKSAITALTMVIDFAPIPIISQ